MTSERMRKDLARRASGAAGPHRQPDERPRQRLDSEAIDESLALPKEIGSEEPKSLDKDMAVGDFVDGLPPHGLTATVCIDGKFWNVSRIELPGPRDADD